MVRRPAAFPCFLVVLAIMASSAACRPRLYVGGPVGAADTAAVTRDTAIAYPDLPRLEPRVMDGASRRDTIGRVELPRINENTPKPDVPVPATPPALPSAEEEASGENQAAARRDSVVQKLTRRVYRFYAAQEMKKDSSYRVRLVLDPVGARVQVSAGGPETEDPVLTDSIRVASQMKATLTDAAGAFDIGSSDPVKPTTGDSMVWKWVVVPRAEGSQVLLLEIVGLDSAGRPLSTSPVKEHEIVVTVPRINKLKELLVKHVELIVTAFLIPLAGAAWAFLRKRKKKKPPPSASRPYSRELDMPDPPTEGRPQEANV
jgi:hypothetical protein